MRVGGHRARPVQGQGGADVVEAGRLHQLQQGAHTGAVELEHTDGVALSQQLEGGGVVKGDGGGTVGGDGVGGEVDTAVLADVVDRVVDDAEIAQSQEVHLDQPQVLAAGVVESGDLRAVPGAHVEGDTVAQAGLGQNDRRGVDPGVTDQPLDAHRSVEDPAHIGVVLVQGTDLAGLPVAGVVLVEDPGQRDRLAPGVLREGLRDALTVRERVAQQTRGVLGGVLRLEPAEGVDHRRVLVAVLLNHVPHHALAVTVVEVEVHIRRVDSLGVQEPFEEQPVLQRAQLGDAHRVRHDRPRRRTTARPDGDLLGAGVPADIRHDEEVRGEPRRADDVHLGLEALHHLAGDRGAVAHGQPLQALLSQPRLLGLPFGGAGVLRHLVSRGEDLLVGLDALRDQQGVVARLREFGEQLPHLGGGLEVVAGAVEPEPVRIVLVLGDSDAQQVVVGVRVLFEDVVGIVRRQRRDAQGLRQTQQVGADVALQGQAVVHQLQEVVLPAEDVLVAGRDVSCLVVLAQAQPGLDRTGGAPGRPDDALGMLRDQLHVHAGLAGRELPRAAGLARQVEQVAQALGVAGPQCHVGEAACAWHIVGSVAVVRHGTLPAGPPELLRAVAAPGRGDVRLDADDRLDAVEALGDLLKLVRTEHVAVVAHRDGGHVLPGGLGEHRLQPLGTVEHRVLGVIVQVDEGIGHREGPSEERGEELTGHENRILMRPPSRASPGQTPLPAGVRPVAAMPPHHSRGPLGVGRGVRAGCQPRLRMASTSRSGCCSCRK
ncbi:hypothetical protein T45_08513 [Streptomyces turgidiscabies]|nr:hypothetical protein T45_08513 [Streptomyces turgidiscabies]